MKMKHAAAVFTVCLLAVLSFSPAADALVARRPMPVGNPIYGCTPAGFTLSRTLKGYHLSGTLPTPTPGYTTTPGTAAFEDDGSLAVTLKLLPPAGMTVQVLSTVKIDADIAPAGTAPAAKITVALDKPFSWGPAAVECKMAGMTQ